MNQSLSVQARLFCTYLKYLTGCSVKMKAGVLLRFISLLSILFLNALPTRPSPLRPIPLELFSAPDYVFIRAIIQRSYPDLQNHQLSEIRQSHDSDSDQTVYQFSYSYSSDGSDSAGVNSSVTVLGYQHGTLYAVLQDGKVVDTYYRQRKQPSIDNNFTSQASNLNPIETEAKQFLTNNLPHLQAWQLIGVQTHKVAGEYICLTFQNSGTSTIEEYCVLSQPWLRGYLQFITPDGTIYIKGGYGCNPQQQALNGSDSGDTNNLQGSKSTWNSSPITENVEKGAGPVTNIPEAEPEGATQNAPNNSSATKPQLSGSTVSINDIFDRTQPSQPSETEQGGLVWVLPPPDTLPSTSKPVPRPDSVKPAPALPPEGRRRLLGSINER